MTDIQFAAALAAVVLGIAHITTPGLRFLDGTPRSAWLSIAGGVSVCYVFIHLLPELAASQASVGELVQGDVIFAERHVYLIALAGLTVFYGVDRLAKTSRSRRLGAPIRGGRDSEGAEAATSPRVFWVHIASFAIYNGLIGYLLMHREVMTLSSLVFFTIAMALHFVVTDYGLNEDHRAQYRNFGRWILICAVFAGLLVGYATEISETAIAMLTAFLAGGVILNVLKEEVPNERQSRFWAFLLGVIGYASLLMTL